MLRLTVLLIVHLLFGLCECGYERCPSKNLRDSDRQLIENEHNSRRSSLAKGLEHCASGNLPKAVDIYKMSYDCQLEKMAQEYANTCDFKDQPEKHVVVDRNQYTSSATNESNKRLVKSATQLWWSEIGNYSVPAGQPPKPNRQYGQFVQMAWSTTVNVGCGISSGCDRKLFVCLYSPPVDYGREVAYSTGKKSCECTAYKNSKCDHSEQLCIASAPFEVTKDIGSTTTIHNGCEGDDREGGQSNGRKYKKSDESGQFEGCPSTTLTDSERQLFLTEHNSRRSSLAKGLEKTAAGFAPKASQMYKMVYDCELERTSQEHADTCKFSHSSHSRKVGENIYSTTAKKLSNDKHVKGSTNAWWSEIKKVSLEAGKPLVYTKGIGHFTQMAWDKTIKIGCGISSNCPNVHVVCEYSPAGNYRNTLVYAVGSPCSRDADCTRYNGSYCSVEEGLCVHPLARAPRRNGAAGYLHGWLGLFGGKMTKDELFISTAYFAVVSGLLASI